MSLKSCVCKMKTKAFDPSVKTWYFGNQEIKICFYCGVQWPAQLSHADSSTLSDVLNKRSEPRWRFWLWSLFYHCSRKIIRTLEISRWTFNCFKVNAQFSDTRTQTTKPFTESTDTEITQVCWGFFLIKEVLSCSLHRNSLA